MATAQTFQQQTQIMRRLFRVPVLSLSVVPVLFGTALAFSDRHRFSLGLLIIALIGTLAAHAASHTTNDYWDYRSGADEAAERVQGGIASNSRLLTGGKVKLAEVGWVTALLFALALVSAAALTLLVGDGVLIFAALGFVLAYFYVAPPIAYGYIGHGLGEALVVIAFGVLPVMGSYYVQTGEVSAAVFWASLPVGLFTSVMLLNHAFFQWQADRLVGKNTPVVVLGPLGALRLSAGMLAASYFGIILDVVFGILPWYALVGLITTPMMINAWRIARQRLDVSGYTRLRMTTLYANRYTGLLLTASLIVAGIVGR